MTPRSALLALLLFATGCDGSRVGRFDLDAVTTADRVTLHSLDGLGGDPVRADGRQEPPERFVYWGSYGSTTLDLAGRRRAVAAIREAIAANDGLVAGCNLPRHALRVESAGVATDLVICFECSNMEIYRDGEMITIVPIFGERPERELDALLTAAGIPLAPKSFDAEPTPEATE